MQASSRRAQEDSRWRPHGASGSEVCRNDLDHDLRAGGARLCEYRQNRGFADHTTETARAELLSWLELGDDEAPAIPREVSIVLASEDFSQEITTTVLWLNEFHAFDIRCVRLTPYKLGVTLLLDVQHVIPLPEASSYTVRVREKEIAVKQANESAADWTKFVVQTPSGATQPLPKRWAMLRLLEGLVEAGISMAQVSQILPPSKSLHVAARTMTTREQLTTVSVVAVSRAPEAAFGRTTRESQASWGTSLTSLTSSAC